jgi:dienelactone hydrolase
MKLLLHALVVCIAALVGGGATPVFAQETSGGYTTRVGGQTFGTETYKITKNADGSRRAEADASFGGMKLKVITAVGADDGPASFEMEVNGAKALTQVFTAAGVKVMAAGQPEKVVDARPEVLLENGIWHHFIFLFARYDARRGGAQTFAALLPSQTLPVKVTLAPVGRESFDVKGQKILTEHFRAQTDLGLAFEVWTDESRTTPLLFAVPAQSLQAVRRGSEDLAAVVFARDAPPAPSASDPYTTEEVTFQNGEQKLSGTLTIPKGGRAPHPAAVIISGSGGQDRDGLSVANIYRLIAERLSSNGVAVLRADDRGVGKSTPLANKASSYRDLVADTRAAFEYLLTRGEIDKGRVALVGHSEGAETALILAAEDPRVAAVALLAGTSRPADRVLVEQSLYQAAMQGAIDPTDETKFSPVARQIKELFEKARSAPKPAAGDDDLAWFREHAEHEPLADARRVRVPALVANGERDALVMPHHALALASEMAAAGNKRVTLRIFRDLTHLFTPASGGEKAGEVSEEFLRALQEWATGVLAKK